MIAEVLETSRAALASALLLLVFAHASSAGAAPQKNILLVISDDLNRMISPLGDPNAITPNLERFAARGVCFDNCLCQFPFCSPSRASLFKGLYPWIHGNLGAAASYPNPHAVFPNRIDLPEYLKRNGYVTASFGKVEHHVKTSHWDVQQGLKHPRFTGVVQEHQHNFSARGITGESWVEVYDLPPESFVDGISTTDAIDFLSQHAATPDPAPFFVGVGFDQPHAPWINPKVFFDLYDPEQILLPETPSDRVLWPGWARKDSSSDTRPPMSDDEKKRMWAAYLAAVTNVDYQFGRLLDFLDARDLWDDTIVIFVSDNGVSMLEHFTIFSKRNVTHEAVSVPMMIHAPGITPQGSTCHRQVQMQDIFPTLIELAGLPPYPAYLSGHSLLPLLADPARPWPHPALSSVANPNATRATALIVQHGSLKIAEGLDANNLLYFDHTTDPLEHYPQRIKKSERPTDPKWAPLHAAFASEFGVEVGQFGVFYNQGSNRAPDRDLDGLTDEEELVLAPLGFDPSRRNPELVRSFLNGPVLSPHSTDPSLLTIQLPGSTHDRSSRLAAPGNELPLVLQESLDGGKWLLSPTPVTEHADGTFEWFVPKREPTRLFRFHDRYPDLPPVTPKASGQQARD